MAFKTEKKTLLWMVAIALACCWLPVGNAGFDNAAIQGLHLVKWYAREHLLWSLVPALLIAGAIATFINKASLMRYLEARANRVVAYGVAALSGAILPVCSCMVLPLFAGICRMGAGLGPACAFLYSGPAINVLAMILTARVLGPRLGVARAVGAVGFSILIGLMMHMIYRKEEREKVQIQMAKAQAEDPTPRPVWRTALFLAAMVAMLVLANWARTGDVRATFLCCPKGLTAYAIEGDLVGRTEAAVSVRDRTGTIHEIPTDVLQEIRPVVKDPLYDIAYALRWSALLVILAGCVYVAPKWFERGELTEWGEESWGYAKRITPMLLIGVLASGFLLGRPGHDGLISGRYVQALVGADPDAFFHITGMAGHGLETTIRSIWPLWTSFFASVLGALMYFSTLTEVPIVQGLMGAGMAKGPALALLLTGPTLSLPSMLALCKVMGIRKTLVFASLVIVTATGYGMVFGRLF
jgi:uncharacterized membrane protein YraQ (UPF0718 family)